MKKMSKFRFAMLLVGVGTYSYLGYSYITREARTKKLVESVWNEIKDELVQELKLPKTPTLNYCTLDNKAACTYCDYFYKPNFNFIEQEIVYTKTSFVIDIDLAKVYDAIQYYKYLILNPFSDDIARAYVRQVLSHECRHIWQANGDFYVGTKIERFASLKNYGDKRQEKDANEFAIVFASNNKELAVATCEKMIQEKVNFTNDSSINSEAIRILKKAF